MLKRALANLMTNAAKFGQRAVVSIEEAGTDVRIRIDDDGPGLPADKIDKVFEPFVRGRAVAKRADGRHRARLADRPLHRQGARRRHLLEEPATRASGGGGAAEVNTTSFRPATRE